MEPTNGIGRNRWWPTWTVGDDSAIGVHTLLVVWADPPMAPLHSSLGTHKYAWRGERVFYPAPFVGDTRGQGNVEYRCWCAPSLCRCAERVTRKTPMFLMSNVLSWTVCATVCASMRSYALVCACMRLYALAHAPRRSLECCHCCGRPRWAKDAPRGPQDGPRALRIAERLPPRPRGSVFDLRNHAEPASTPSISATWQP